MKKLIFKILILIFFQSCNNSESSTIVNDQTLGIEETELKIPYSAGLNLDNDVSNIKIPNWVIKKFKILNLANKLEMKSRRKFLIEDFNGDKHKDIVIQVQNKQTKEMGLIILNQDDDKKYYQFGAGEEIENMTNLNWIEIIEPIEEGTEISKLLIDEETGDIIGIDSSSLKQIRTAGINIGMEESHGGGIIYWEGNKYEWLSQE